MTIYAVVGEDSDYDRIGTITNAVNTTAGNFRTVARCGIQAYPPSSANVNTSFGKKDTIALTSMWLTARLLHIATSNTAGYMLLGFGKTSNRRLGLFSSGTTGKLSIGKVDAAGTITLLATESGTFLAAL